MQFYIPSGMLVALSWSSFWISVDAVVARVNIGLMIILALTTQSIEARKELPRVSYIKAIDVWTSTCLVFTFSSLIEFALVNIRSRRDARRAQEPRCRWRLHRRRRRRQRRTATTPAAGAPPPATALPTTATSVGPPGGGNGNAVGGCGASTTLTIESPMKKELSVSKVSFYFFIFCLNCGCICICLDRRSNSTLGLGSMLRESRSLSTHNSFREFYRLLLWI
jgi:hypothetical protein